jgi:large subunit ribosomal protein L6
MSRVGKNPIKVPASIAFSVEGRNLSFKGKTATQAYCLPEGIDFVKENDNLVLKPQNDSMSLRSLWGTAQRNIVNIVHGLEKGFTKNVELVGVGYRAAVAGQKLTLQLGFSHEVVFDIPNGIAIKCEKPTSISIMGHCKQEVGQVAAKLKTYRPPEPYKGKGVIREGDFIVRKEGKKK